MLNNVPPMPCKPYSHIEYYLFTVIPLAGNKTKNISLTYTGSDRCHSN